MSEPLIVQFIHPGGEHTRFEEIGEVLTTPWNPSHIKHRRKFLLQRGKWVATKGTEIDSRWTTGEDDLMFWGEWEPESTLEKSLTHDDWEPQFLVRPYWQAKRSYYGYHNTDPYVFQSPFHYIICMQSGEMRRLPKGSLILFGSQDRRRSEFFIDTVFVVDEGCPYVQERVRTELAPPKVSNTYYSVSVAPMIEDTGCAPVSKKETKQVLYSGATYEKPVHEMFSFFPCQRYRQQGRGFARPVIKLDEHARRPDGKSVPIVDGSMFNAKRYTCHGSLDEVADIWRQIVGQVVERGLLLGVEADEPEHRA